ncbi:CBS domain-containing protein [Enterobacter chuandaensis]|uniref:CBS domain-containing protein n=1 Tax=Enterobacter chuandaensis TaxID=2497875 RepID=UPI0020761300|nr:CBS domain-containing protein [Enterobacter chuandaensis]MCM7590673.1 CBS domain-containing protein [Enterobacter chuandaensis]
MGAQLWMSPLTGYRRNGTRFESINSIFLEKISVDLICEPILCCKDSDDASDAHYALTQRDFDITAVVSENGEIIGQVEREKLKQGKVYNYISGIEETSCIDEKTSLVELLEILKDDFFKYVTSDGKIVAIITRADLNKPLPRTYFFGIISLIEMHLNFWITYYFPNNQWGKYVNSERMEGAKTIFEARKGLNDSISLLDCIQFCDKKSILRNNSEFLSIFEFSSKSKFDRYMKFIEKIRNEIAHSQNSIISGLEWKDFVHTLSFSRTLLTLSDVKVEEDCRKKAEQFKDDMLVSIRVS